VSISRQKKKSNGKISLCQEKDAVIVVVVVVVIIIKKIDKKTTKKQKRFPCNYMKNPLFTTIVKFRLWPS
jgi:hypothetical protein